MWHDTNVMINVVTHGHMVDEHSVLLNDCDLSISFTVKQFDLAVPDFPRTISGTMRYVWDHPSPVLISHTLPRL
jgi:hypothetical protein